VICDMNLKISKTPILSIHAARERQLAPTKNTVESTYISRLTDAIARHRKSGSLLSRHTRRTIEHGKYLLCVATRNGARCAIRRNILSSPETDEGGVREVKMLVNPNRTPTTSTGIKNQDSQHPARATGDLSGRTRQE
jgi:hypothetical protein